MSYTVNVYCDESCHLIHDNSDVMLLGAVWFPSRKKEEIFSRIKEIKDKHKLSTYFEVKWNKVSPAKEDFFIDLVNYFFDDDDLHYRGLVVQKKSKLNHERFNQTHDTFYYKMYFNLIKIILSPDYSYNIYLDIKDTRSQEKVDKLHEVLCSTHYDFQQRIIKRIQQVRSHEVQALQIADLLTGSISYLHRGLKGSETKTRLIEKIRQRSGYTLSASTLPKESKFNLFFWQPNFASDE